MSILLNDAIKIVEEKLRTLGEKDVEYKILHDEIIDRENYWVFFYNSSKFIETGDYSYAIAGNSPFIVDKIEGKIYKTGTANPIEYYLRLFDKKYK